jgi:ketosteroid isomerase-like protein
MTAQDNVQVVQQMFVALGNGNLAAALNAYAEDVDFRSPVTWTESVDISWAKPRHSREEVATFFKELSEIVAIDKMEPLEITAEGDRVIVEGRNRFTVRSTGRNLEHDWVMVFKLRAGKIVRNWHYYDTGDVLVAIRGEKPI